LYVGRNYWTKCEPFLSKILIDLCITFGDAHLTTTQNKRVDKNPFPQTPFLFARLLLGLAKIFSEADGLQSKIRIKGIHNLRKYFIF
jgi:hypothetical protein